MANELTFSTSLRPVEELKLKTADFVHQSRSLEGYPRSILAVALFERGESSKTGIFDGVVIRDDTRVFETPRATYRHSTATTALTSETPPPEQESFWRRPHILFLQIDRLCARIKAGDVDASSQKL